MAMLWILSLVALVCLSSHPSLTDACSCAPLMPQDEYCSSDLVIKIFVTGPAEVIIEEIDGTIRPATQKEIDADTNYQGSMYRRYRYTTRKIYKGSAPYSGYAYTLFHGNLCGSWMDTDSYILMGSGPANFGGQLSLSFHLCQYVRRWSAVDKFTKKLLKKHSNPKLCDCEIEYCYDEGCTGGPTSSVNACPPILPYGSESSCHRMTTCWRKKNGICAWKRTRTFKRCMN